MKIECAHCGEAIKNATRQAKLYQLGKPSKVVVNGPDIYHTECFNDWSGRCDVCGQIESRDYLFDHYLGSICKNCEEKNEA